MDWKRAARWLGPASLALAPGCGSDAADPLGGAIRSDPSTLPERAAPLQIPAEAWVSASVAEDPFVEFADGRLRCSPFAFRLEANWLEVATTDCNYATLVYRFTRAVVAGEAVSGEVAWATLASLEPAVGTLAFATERDGVIWTHAVDIPGQADITEVHFTLANAAPAGGALYFHVRNHGYNTWQLSPLTLTEPSG